MNRKSLVLLVALIVILTLVGGIVPMGATTSAAGQVALARLQQDAVGEIELVWNTQTHTPSFVSGAIPVTSVSLQADASAEEIALDFARAYADLFRLQQVDRELVVTASERDTIGMDHVTLQQLYHGIPVHNATMRVHIQEQTIVAATNGVVPDLWLSATQPTVSAAEALAIAQAVAPGGKAIHPPALVVYTGDNYLPLLHGKLVWLVDLSRPDGPPARYVVDATEPFLLDIIARTPLGTPITDTVATASEAAAELTLTPMSPALSNPEPAQNAPLIETYDSQGTKVFPRTPVRVGDNPPVGRTEVDNAHNFTRETFDYFRNVHGRNSFDDQGTVMRSTVNYGTNYVNAFWEGLNLYTAYGTGLAVKDVVAHEWTHAVTQHTANLEYRWQSGALNESFSDIFAAMVDRDDWLIGEDIPSRLLGGADAMRSLSHPERYEQPWHTDEWKRTCSDNEGVHTNSGITNHAYYLIATDIGKDKAEQIFYRALTTYVQPKSSLRDARAAALSAATDLYERDSDEYRAVDRGFRSVGITNSWDPPTNNCSCAATQVLAERSLFADALQALDIAVTLYQVRDQLLDSESLGQHYRTLYEEHSARIGMLLASKTTLRTQAAHLLRSTQPGLQSLVDPDMTDEIVTAEDVRDVTAFLQDLAQTDRAENGGELAQTIEQELAQTDLQKLVGMTYAQAWEYLNNTAYTLYMPMIVR